MTKLLAVDKPVYLPWLIELPMLLLPIWVVVIATVVAAPAIVVAVVCSMQRDNWCYSD